MPRHADATILEVELCGYCGLPKCIHFHCINVPECSHADATRCRCYIIYAPGHRQHNQSMVGSEQSRANGRKRKSAA